jgi:hypothetical protein
LFRGKQWSMEYQLGKVLVRMVVCVVWLTTTVEAMGGAVRRSDTGTISPVRSLPELPALRMEDQKRSMSDGGVRQAERGGVARTALSRNETTSRNLKGWVP